MKSTGSARTTAYNGTSVFSASTTSIFLTDANSSSTITNSVGALSTTVLGLTTGGTNTSLAGTDGTGAQAALTAIDAAIQTVANDRGAIGASVGAPAGRLGGYDHAGQNLTAAENNIMAADIPSTISNLSRESVLSQTGMAALAQANSQEQSILTLLH